jgi:hypothetical protein
MSLVSSGLWSTSLQKVLYNRNRYFDTFWLGTSYILEDQRNDHTALDSRLKYDRSGDVPILLVPQPSDDPNDPLVGRKRYNWQS